LKIEVKHSTADHMFSLEMTVTMRKYISTKRINKQVPLPGPVTYTGKLFIVHTTSIEEYHHAGDPLSQLCVH
jgi:hypothetical protein